MKKTFLLPFFLCLDACSSLSDSTVIMKGNPDTVTNLKPSEKPLSTSEDPYPLSIAPQIGVSVPLGT